MDLPVLSVTQLNTYVKSLLDGDPRLGDLFIRGEISNFKRHSSGHLYLTLKDDNSRVAAVMFRFNAMRMRFMPQDGMRVIARGRVSVYDRDGKYQLYIEEMHPDGVGDLSVAYEQLKERLAAEGLFDREHKKPLPRYPSRVGVITSPTGAAVHDIITVLARRFPAADLVLCPVLVQGDGAAEEICAALELFNRKDAADVIILGRGGGSIEDLWAFNEEPVARAVYRSRIPVISAVGHETDFTICDFVADVRAATPSAAAELAVPDAREIAAHLATLNTQIVGGAASGLAERKARLTAVRAYPCFQSPLHGLEQPRQRLDTCASALRDGMGRLLTDRRRRLAELAAALDHLSPLKVLARGYSIAESEAGTVLTSVKQVKTGNPILLRMADGRLGCTVHRIDPITEDEKHGKDL